VDEPVPLATRVPEIEGEEDDGVETVPDARVTPIAVAVTLPIEVTTGEVPVTKVVLMPEPVKPEASLYE
jgi:hypothetical protein